MAFMRLEVSEWGRAKEGSHLLLDLYSGKGLCILLFLGNCLADRDALGAEGITNVRIEQ